MGGNPMSAFDPKQTLRSLELLLTNQIPLPVAVGIIDKLNKEINAGLADPNTKSRFANFGGIILASSPGDFGKLIVDETEKWAKVIKFAGIKVD
jgi:tripartite-type tricarboxylate transporter receptor subunit TctC